MMRTATRLLPLLMVSACAIGGDTDGSISSALSGTASISLAGSSARVTLTSDNVWTLEKTGSLSGNTVTWNITATKTATTSGHLLIQGQMTVTNTGSGPATIGNIVVNLQKRVGNTWVTQVSDVANATDGDAATTATIHKAASSENKATFTESAASGALNFMDATNNTVFSLTPQQMIGAGQTRPLLFSAAFDNNLLALAAGTPIRAEVIVTFGNATLNGNSTANLDINGNGSIDSDENRVRSVPSRLGVTVPAAVNGNSQVTLSDALSDISSTGDVTFSNVQFDLGATSGTVTASVTGGVNGGNITNCAHLTSPDQTVNSGGFNFSVIDGLDLLACSTINVGGTPPTCTPGRIGCGWEQGDMQTFTQSTWGDPATPAGSLATANFASVYPSYLVVGGTFTITLRDDDAVFRLLPTVGTAGSLNANLLDPQTSSGGELAGELVALELNSDFTTVLGNALSLGSLRICNLTSPASLNGQTVDQFLAIGNHILGGGSASFSATTAASIARALNSAFVDGAPSNFAQAALFDAPACP